MKHLLLSILALSFLANPAFADTEVVHSVVGVQGYDLVSYHNNKRPLQGNGNHVATHEGVNYLFVDQANLDTFNKNPDKYLPAYGGWCAFGVAVNKKFIGDPTVWEIVDGKLYLNLGNNIKGMWVKDIPGHIKTANANWPKIKDKSPAEL